LLIAAHAAPPLYLRKSYAFADGLPTGSRGFAAAQAKGLRGHIWILEGKLHPQAETGD